MKLLVFLLLLSFLALANAESSMLKDDWSIGETAYTCEQTKGLSKPTILACQVKILEIQGTRYKVQSDIKQYGCPEYGRFIILIMLLVSCISRVGVRSMGSDFLGATLMFNTFPFLSSPKHCQSL